MKFSAPPRDWRAWPQWLRETPGSNVLVLRAFLGVTFVVASLQKLANPAFFRASTPTGIQATMKSAQTFSPIGGLLGPAIHVAALIGVVIAFGELAVGLGTLLGFRARLAAGGGMLLSLMFFLTVSWSTTPYYYGADIVFFFAWTAILLGGPGSFSTDAWLASRRAEATAAAPPGEGQAVDRREAVRKMGVTAGLTAFAAVFGGLASAVGRLVSNSSGGGSASGATLAGPSGTTGSSGTTGTTVPGGKGSKGTPKGRRIGPASDVPVGSAAPFTYQNVTPAYVVRPADAEFLGFSRICTHEGCTVNYVHATQQFLCPCHGSIYSAVTGSVISGPAPLPLPKIPIAEASDGQLYAD
ncbi:MAG: Rieske 2Fe-2S domain-containing protein [Acidimicrobiales bacterium]